MMVAARTRFFDEPVDRVWAFVGDPWRLPLWWPRTERVEGVSGNGWTTVLRTDRGRLIRADWRLDVSRKPTRRAWSQELANTPFERLFERNAVEMLLEDVEGGGTRVTMRIEQRVHGWARLAPFLIRRAAKRQIREALDGLDAVLEDDGE